MLRTLCKIEEPSLESGNLEFGDARFVRSSLQFCEGFAAGRMARVSCFFCSHLTVLFTCLPYDTRFCAGFG